MKRGNKALANQQSNGIKLYYMNKTETWSGKQTPGATRINDEQCPKHESFNVIILAAKHQLVFHIYLTNTRYNIHKYTSAMYLYK